ncbi:hypothetical protein GCM10010467_15010 [Actinocorallia glomerata]|uniref:Uncharacterized protein n=2 Tax=Actinomycetes TaxID=1760 RepID=A0ABP6M4T6_9MICC
MSLTETEAPAAIFAQSGAALSPDQRVVDLLLGPRRRALAWRSLWVVVGLSLPPLASKGAASPAG